MITVQLENLFSHKVGKSGITSDTEREFAAKRVEVAQEIAGRVKQGEYEFVNYLQNQADQDIKAISTWLGRNKWINTLVVIGIGGSDLGGRTIRQALAKEAKTQNPNINVLFLGDSTDPSDIEWLMHRISPRSTVFNIVSKSGKTMEVMAQYAFWKSIMLKKRPQSWRKYFVFTTDKDSALWNEGLKHHVKTFQIPDDVGGRYSVLTAVGLLPAVAMGIDASAMVAAARAAAAAFVSNPVDAPSTLVAWAQYLLYKQSGLKLSIFMPYSVKLTEMGRWYRQLWAESLGKDGKGILPIQARGPADQHSQLQYYAQGELLGSVWFLKVHDHKLSYKIGHTDNPDLQYLEGKDFADLINIEHQATADSLTDMHRPNATIEIDQINAHTIGELFMTFELAVVILAEFMEVNAFDQPGVQDSKDRIAQMLH